MTNLEDSNLDFLDYDMEVLRAIGGEKMPDLKWGAAMSHSVEYLKGRGLIRMLSFSPQGGFKLTEKGEAFLKAYYEGQHNG